jgi:hypothetical protein
LATDTDTDTTTYTDKELIMDMNSTPNTPNRNRKIAPVSAPAVLPGQLPASPSSPQRDAVLAQPEPWQIELERLRAENAALKAGAKTQTLSLKVSEKGGVSVYGLGKFPITLYWEQWERLLALAEHIREFIKVNKHLLKSKDQK